MSDDDRIPEPVKRRHVINAADARDQATEMYSFLASTFIKAGDEEFEVPHKDLLDPEQQERYDELQLEIEGYDREPDLVELTTEDGRVIRPAGPGPVKTPHRRNGKLIKPPLSERHGIVLWGKEGAARFRAAGGNFNLIDIIWGDQVVQLRKWREADSKSADGDSGVASASDGD